MQSFASSANKLVGPEPSIDLMQFIGFRNSWKLHNSPGGILFEHMPNQVVLMQPLHDENDGPDPLVIEAPVEMKMPFQKVTSRLGN